MNCATCQELADGNSLKCNGSCGNLFHISCLSPKNGNYKNALIGYLSKIPNLRWYCDCCVSLPLDTPVYVSNELTNRLADIKAFAENYLTILNSGTSTTQTGIGNSTSPQIVGVNATSLNGSFTTAASDSDQMDQSSPTKSLSPQNLNTSPLQNKITTRKRHLAPSSPGTGQLSKQQKVGDGQPLSLADLIAKPKPKAVPEPQITVKTNMVRSIYITPFDPSTEPSHIMHHLESNDDLKHIVPAITCTKLASKKRYVTFVSFKLDVPRHHYDIVVNPKIWQTNGKDELTINEFVDKRKSNGHGSPGINGNQNPFKKPIHAQLQRSSIIAKSTGSNRQHNKSTTSKFEQSNRQNFQHRCQKQCCSQPKPQCYRCHDHFEENRFGHRPINRR